MLSNRFQQCCPLFFLFLLGQYAVNMDTVFIQNDELVQRQEKTDKKIEVNELEHKELLELTQKQIVKLEEIDTEWSERRRKFYSECNDLSATTRNMTASEKLAYVRMVLSKGHKIDSEGQQKVNQVLTKAQIKRMVKIRFVRSAKIGTLKENLQNPIFLKVIGLKGNEIPKIGQKVKELDAERIEKIGMVRFRNDKELIRSLPKKARNKFKQLLKLDVISLEFYPLLQQEFRGVEASEFSATWWDLEKDRKRKWRFKTDKDWDEGQQLIRQSQLLALDFELQLVLSLTAIQQNNLNVIRRRWMPKVAEHIKQIWYFEKATEKRMRKRKLFQIEMMDRSSELIFEIEESVKDCFTQEQYQKLNAYRLQALIRSVGIEGSLCTPEIHRLLDLGESDQLALKKNIDKFQQKKILKAKKIESKFQSDIVKLLPEHVKRKFRQLFESKL